jgi:peptide/nickel transport system ATP-binding protein
MPETLLSIRNLCVDYITDRGPVRAIDNVSLDLHAGEILGVAGESGSGKSTLAQAIMRILRPPAVISRGSVMFEGRDLMQLDEPELQQVRWERISMVFQSAMDSLNPVITIGEQILDTLEAHGGARGASGRKRAEELLDLVGIPRSRLGNYAHQLSGGMRQRVGIALALALNPSLVILDEPTTALDVIVEAEILDRIRVLQKELGFSVMFITHDLARMLEVSDRVAVFYAARLAETGPAAAMGTTPRHPYTNGLLRAFPPPVKEMNRMPESIPGTPPSLENPPTGCRFHPRCSLVEDRCRTEEPPVHEIGPGHSTSCHLAK